MASDQASSVDVRGERDTIMYHCATGQETIIYDASGMAAISMDIAVDVAQAGAGQTCAYCGYSGHVQSSCPLLVGNRTPGGDLALSTVVA